MKISIDIMYGLKGPQPKQIEFRDLDKPYKLFAGGVRAGKTRTLCAEALRMSLGFPGNRGLMARQEGTKFKDTTLVEFNKLVDELESGLHTKIVEHHNKTERMIYFPNGSIIKYGGFDSTNRQTNVKSFECGWFAIDEANEINEADFNFLLSRPSLRLPNGTRPPYMGFLASNVEDCWLYDRFVNPSTRNPNLGYISAATSDNEEYLPKNYVARLMALNSSEWNDQYTHSSWKFNKGKIFVNFDPLIHCLGELPTKKPHYKLHAGIDHGQSHPTAAIASFIDDDDNIFMYREYKKPGIVSEHCKNLNILFDGFEGFATIMFSPDAFGKTREQNNAPWSIADEYLKHNIMVQKANNAVDQGLSRMLQLLNVDPDHRHPITGKLGSPRLFISKHNCPELIKEMESYRQHKTKDGVYQEKPRKVNDDLVDALRYAIMSIGQMATAYRPKAMSRYERLCQPISEGIPVSW